MASSKLNFSFYEDDSVVDDFDFGDLQALKDIFEKQRLSEQSDVADFNLSLQDSSPPPELDATYGMGLSEIQSFRYKMPSSKKVRHNKSVRPKPHVRPEFSPGEVAAFEKRQRRRHVVQECKSRPCPPPEARLLNFYTGAWCPPGFWSDTPRPSAKESAEVRRLCADREINLSSFKGNDLDRLREVIAEVQMRRASEKERLKAAMHSKASHGPAVPPSSVDPSKQGNCNGSAASPVPQEPGVPQGSSPGMLMLLPMVAPNETRVHSAIGSSPPMIARIIQDPRAHCERVKYHGIRATYYAHSVPPAQRDGHWHPFPLPSEVQCLGSWVAVFPRGDRLERFHAILFDIQLVLNWAHVPSASEHKERILCLFNQDINTVDFSERIVEFAYDEGFVGVCHNACATHSLLDLNSVSQQTHPNQIGLSCPRCDIRLGIGCFDQTLIFCCDENGQDSLTALVSTLDSDVHIFPNKTWYVPDLSVSRFAIVLQNPNGFFIGDYDAEDHISLELMRIGVADRSGTFRRFSEMEPPWSRGTTLIHGFYDPRDFNWGPEWLSLGFFYEDDEDDVQYPPHVPAEFTNSGLYGGAHGSDRKRADKLRKSCSKPRNPEELSEHKEQHRQDRVQDKNDFRNDVYVRRAKFHGYLGSNPDCIPNDVKDECDFKGVFRRSNVDVVTIGEKPLHFCACCGGGAQQCSNCHFWVHDSLAVDHHAFARAMIQKK